MCRQANYTKLIVIPGNKTYVHVQKNTYYMYTLMTSDLYEYF